MKRTASTTDEWLTKPSIVEALGPFDLDPCAPIERPWPTAFHHYTILDNGLRRAWWGRVWLNPPYGRATGRWMARLAAHGTGTALIFARTETEFFFRHVWESAAALFFFEGRLHFHLVDGSEARRKAPAPSVLVAYGQHDAERLAAFEGEGKFVPLVVPRLIAFAASIEEPTWREIVSATLRARPGPVPLDELYRAITGHPKATGNQHWQAKIRQVLQKGPFRRVDRGVWEMCSD